jgi:ubiquinone/menaquinone biosynthesis C-methylase UbiE
MTELFNKPEIDASRLMEEIRNEIGGKERPKIPHGLLSGVAGHFRDRLPRIQGSAMREFNPLSTLSFQDLTHFHDTEFIRNAYLAILKRFPDSNGEASYLSRLREGSINKIEVLGRLRYSSEGRSAGVTIRGLLPRFLLWTFFKVPILGHIAASAYLVLRLPAMVRQNQADEQSSALFERRLINEINTLTGSIEQCLSGLSESQTRALEELERRVSEQYAQFDANATKLSERLDVELPDVENRLAREATLLRTEFDNRVNELNDLQQKHSSYIDDHNSHLADLTSLSETVKNTSEKLINLTKNHDLLLAAQKREIVDITRRLKNSQPSELAREVANSPVIKGNEQAPDVFYVSLEDRFRGSTSDIKESLRHYLPKLSKLDGESKCLDIGCGRGEWMELLRDVGVECRGVDLNHIMAAECQERGNDVEVSDAFEYLSSLPDESLDLITGFHIIEHLPLVALLGLFDECLRVLRPGGQVIFETPNPENIMVGAYNFYFDPTHSNPLPPELVVFYAENAGFVDVEVDRVNAELLPNPFPQNSENQDIARLHEFLSNRFFSAPDYAVLAKKADAVVELN